MTTKQRAQQPNIRFSALKHLRKPRHITAAADDDSRNKLDNVSSPEGLSDDEGSSTEEVPDNIHMQPAQQTP
jgi:hypothetical protein